MTREDIIRMAREAGIRNDCDGIWCNADQLARFAALVRADERKAMAAEAAKHGWAMKNDDPFEDAVLEIAAIRARGQA